MKDEVCVRIECLRPEFLIRRALDAGIVFQSIARTEKRTVLFHLASRDAGILLKLCKRFSISAKVVDSRGYPRYAKALQTRITLIPAAALFIILCWFSLSRIWFINIVFTGPQAHLGSETALRTHLESSGIHPGIPRNLDFSSLSGNLASNIEGMSYISAKAQGVRLLVEAAPEIPRPDVYDINDVHDLCSAFDGIVVSAEVHSGVACVQPGDIVKRGQVLIRGEEQVTSEVTRPIAARGEVIIRTWYDGNAAGHLLHEIQVPTGRTGVSTRLRLMDFTLPLAESEDYALCSVQREHLPIGGLFLPLEIVREVRTELRKTVVEADLESLSDHLNVLSMADAAACLSLNGPSEFEPVRSWIQYEDTEEGVLKAHAVYEIYTNAAVTRRALLQGG